MLLSDRDIARAIASRHIEIVPPLKRLNGREIQPASLEVHLDWERQITSPDPNHWSNWLTLEPDEFRLAHTVERIKMPIDLAARVEGKSSLGRLGLLVHTAGFIDPGFEGQITLELKNLHHQKPIKLAIGQPVAQIAFFHTSGPVLRPYGSEALGSHYQGQMGTTPSYLE